MINIKHYQILSTHPKDVGLQKCHIGYDLFKLLEANLGQCAYICQKNNVVICKLWPMKTLGQSYVQVDSSVHCGRCIDNQPLNCSGHYRDNGLDYISADCIHVCSETEFSEISVNVVVKNYKQVAFYKKNLTKVNNIVKEILHTYVVNVVSTVEAYRHQLGKLHGIDYIIIDTPINQIDIKLGKVTERTNLIVKRVESKEHYEQRKKFTNLKVGGLEKVKQSISQIIDVPRQHRKELKALGVTCPKSVLLRGPPGCGKSTLIKVIAYESNAYLLTITGPELTGSRPGETEQNLKELFQKAYSLCEDGNCILFLDEIDSFSCKKGKVSSSQDRRPLAQLVQLLDALNEDGDNNLVVVAATNRPGDLDPELRRPGRLDREVFIGIPNQAERQDILNVITSNVSLDSSINLEWLAEATPGYVGADLKLLMQQAYYSALDRGKVNVNISDIKQALHETVPSSQKGSDVFVDHIPVQWDEIGGLHEVKQQIRQAIELPIKHPEAFIRLGLPRPKGVLLYGPPGCAKTTLVRAAASSCHVTFLSVSSAQLYSPFVGDSEKKITEIFKQARAGAPCILFFDEIDSLVGNRSKDSKQGGVQERVLSTLLNEMDGVGLKVDTLQVSNRNKTMITEQGIENNTALPEKKTEFVDNNAVLVVAATNRPDMLDDAIIRPGRIDKIIYVPPPDMQTRLEIFKVHTRKMPINDELDLSSLAEKTEHFTGADIESFCREAALHALSVDGVDVTLVTKKHFDEVFCRIQPSISQHQLKQYEKMRF